VSILLVLLLLSLLLLLLSLLICSVGVVFVVFLFIIVVVVFEVYFLLGVASGGLKLALIMSSGSQRRISASFKFRTYSIAS